MQCLRNIEMTLRACALRVCLRQQGMRFARALCPQGSRPGPMVYRSLRGSDWMEANS